MRYYKYKLNTILLNVYAVILFLILLAGVILTFDFQFNRYGLLEILIIIGWFILHELLHYIGFLCSKGTKTKDLYLGMCIEKGIFYCQCKKKINKKDILIALNFPLFIIGFLTLAIGYFINSSFLVMLSIMNIAGAIGDIVMTIQILRFPKDIKYFDLDSVDSYYILSKKDLSKIKISGIQLLETNDYEENKMTYKDKRKIVISKVSWIFLLLFILFMVLLLFIE